MSFKSRALMVDVVPKRQGFACGEATRNEGDDECGEATREYAPSLPRAADLAVLRQQLREILG